MIALQRIRGGGKGGPVPARGTGPAGMAFISLGKRREKQVDTRRERNPLSTIPKGIPRRGSLMS